MKKDDYTALATELEVNVTEDNTIAEIKEALCDALIKERASFEEEVAGLNESLTRAGKVVKAKAEVVTIGNEDFRYIGVKHLFRGEEITAEKLNNDADLANACLKAGVGFLIKL